MKRAILIVFAILLTPITFFSFSFAAPTFEIESLTVLPGATSVDVNLNIFGDLPDFPIDSAAFTINNIAGFTLTSVAFPNLPANWVPTVNVAANRFGATDFGFPANPLPEDVLPYAILSFNFASDFFTSANPSVVIDFASWVITNPVGNNYILSADQFDSGTVSLVPIPPTIMLLGGGLIGLLALRRRRA